MLRAADQGPRRASDKGGQGGWGWRGRGTAFKGHKGKGFPKGKGRPGVWVTIGPSEAVYPFFPLRTSSLYVPNEYVAGGRTTALALAGDCDSGRCRLYAGPAGGGLWRTDKALQAHPKWTYLSTPFEINSV